MVTFRILLTTRGGAFAGGLPPEGVTVTTIVSLAVKPGVPESVARITIVAVPF
jgi:hypothetical protein